RPGACAAGRNGAAPEPRAPPARPPRRPPREPGGMRIALLLRNVDERNGAGTYARRIARSLMREDPGNEYVLVFASEAARERHGHPAARNLAVEARSKLLWDQVAVPRALRRESVDVIFSTKHSIPLMPIAPRVFMLHGADWIAF